MRNDINYRQTEGLWYPYRGNHKSGNLVAEIRSMLTGEIGVDEVIDRAGNDMVRLRAACCFVILVARGVLAELNGVGGANCFLRFGHIQFEAAMANAAASRP
jgi:hypothetical protein